MHTYTCMCVYVYVCELEGWAIMKLYKSRASHSEYNQWLLPKGGVSERGYK